MTTWKTTSLLVALLACGAACGNGADADDQPKSEEEQILEQVPTGEEADAAAAEEINADNLEETLDEIDEETGG